MNNSQSNDFHFRCIRNLDIAISQCRDNNSMLVLLAKKAGVLARYSYVVEARSIISELNKANSQYDSRLSGWIIFAEGMIEHFEKLDNQKSKEKFLRSFLVGQMAYDRELSGAAAAWMALCEFVSGQIQAAIDHVITAFEWSDSDFGEARGRACMVLADAFNWAGDLSAAKLWYKKARNHAIHDGDIAMQNVMLFNYAAFNISSMNLADCIGEIDSEDYKYISLEVSSAKNLNTAIGIQTLSSLISIMQAELCVVQRKWAEAVNLFDAHIDAIVADGQARIMPRLVAQRAWCKANLGDIRGSAEDIQIARSLVEITQDVDDLAVLHFRVAAAAKLIQAHELEQEHMKMAVGYLSDYRVHQKKIRDILDVAMPRILEATKNPT